jgi:hypothetical protein
VGGELHLFEEGREVATIGQTLREIGEDQAAVSLGDRVPDLREHVRNRHVYPLDPAHVENEVGAFAELGFDGAVQLVSGAEEQAALQFDDHRLLASLLQRLHLSH